MISNHIYDASHDLRGTTIEAHILRHSIVVLKNRSLPEDTSSLDRSRANPEMNKEILFPRKYITSESMKVLFVGRCYA